MKFVLDLLKELSERGTSFTLITGDPKDCPKEWKESRSTRQRIVQIDRPNKLTNRITNGARDVIHPIIKKADLVHLHMPWLPGNIQVAAEANALGVPYIVTLHGTLADWAMAQKRCKKQCYMALMGQRFLHGAAFVHCTAEQERKQAAWLVPQAKWWVAPLLVDLSEYKNIRCQALRRKSPAGLVSAPNVLFLSRLHRSKGVEHLLRASALLRDRGVHCNVLVAGPADPGYLRRLNEMVSSIRIDHRVKFFGMVRGKEKSSLYANSDLFVLPTSHENFGLVLAEALAVGTPIITTYGVDIWRELKSGGATIVNQNPDELATAIETCLSNRTQLKRLGKQGQRFILDWLATDDVAKRYARLYTSMAHSNSSQSPRHL